MLDWITKNPVRCMAILTAVLGAFSPFLPAALIAGLLGVAAAVLGVTVHGIVTPVTTAASQIADSATQAATQVARDLSETTAGAINELTDAGTSIVNGSVRQVLDHLLPTKGATS